MTLRFSTVLLSLALCANAPARADNSVDKVRRHEAKMSFIDNGVVKLGVDLNLGGSITYLARSGTDQNLVNSFDFGRQIQMSYYSGPIPFQVEGKEPKKEWNFIGWNPIQVGDAFGNGSKLLEQQNDGKSIYVKCVPMHWPLENVPGECTFECWYELDGSVVKARCRLVNDRPDKTRYAARHQELPALYTNAPWHRLMTYTGNKPFTGGETTRIVKKKEEAGPWSRWTATESWAALVDDDGFGLGVWCPKVCEFGGGFSGKPGTGGPTDPPTGYIAPSPLEIIDWNIRHEYQYALIVGKLDEIRKYVYDHASKGLPTWKFDQSRAGWTMINATDAGFPMTGQWDVQLVKPDPQLISPVGCWRAEDAGTLVIEAASKTKATDGRIYWRTLGEKAFTPEKSLAFTLTSDGDYHTYHIRLADAPECKGAITQLRFDPVGEGGAEDWIRIRSIHLER